MKKLFIQTDLPFGESCGAIEFSKVVRSAEHFLSLDFNLNNNFPVKKSNGCYSFSVFIAGDFPVERILNIPHVVEIKEEN